MCYNLQQLEETRNLTQQSLYLNYKRYTGTSGTSQADLQQLKDTRTDTSTRVEDTCISTTRGTRVQEVQVNSVTTQGI